MKTSQVLEQSHALFTGAVDDLTEAQWDTPNVCGEWSTKDVVTHLASYERLLLDILRTFQGDALTPYVRSFLADGAAFNRRMVEARKYETAQQVLNAYQDAQVQTTSLLQQIPEEKTREPGTMSWFGAERCLADVVAMMCAHTKEHTDQIIAFREHLKAQPSS